MKARGIKAREALDNAGGLAVLGLLALLSGAAAGLIGAVFRLVLEKGDGLRTLAVAWSRGYPLAGPLMLMLAAAAVAALSAGLVRRYAPMASGSGIPHVEAVLDGELSPAPARLIPIKFAGGALAMSGGLALGREGPSVQMGATIANLIGAVFRRDREDRHALLAGGAGAGLATAFNAPGAGAVFVLEELTGRFEMRTAVVALGASAGAIIVSRAILGDAAMFSFSPAGTGGVAGQVLFLLLGIFCGGLAVLYNRSLLATLSLVERIRLPVEVRAAVIGGAVGLLAWVLPGMVGSGDRITQGALSGELVLATLPALFLFRLALGAFSYAAATPGGLFAPLIALGAIVGYGFGVFAAAMFPELGLRPQVFAVVGMGAFFAGVVRAPITGIVLVTEMTGSADMVLPLLSGCFGAMLIAGALGDQPIYAALRERASQAMR